MTEVIFLHGGIVNKFIGDAVLAVFGLTPGAESDEYTEEVPLEPQVPDAVNAVRCAREMLVALDQFNVWWEAQGQEPVRIGIGLHRGVVVHGNVGSPTRMDHTIIGDAVNTASRVESLTKELAEPVLFTEAVVTAFGGEKLEVRHVDRRVLRGRSQSTDLFTLG
jgi:class 3 adenylate cyclase